MTIKDYMRKVESAKMTPKDSAGASFTDAMMENTEMMELPLMRQRIFTANTERRERLSEFYRKLVWASINSN